MAIGYAFVRCIALPYTVNGVTLPNQDGSFTVYINSIHSQDKQKKTLAHELAHVRLDHFYSEVQIRENEQDVLCADGKKLPDSFVFYSRSRVPAPPEVRLELYRVLDTTIDRVLEQL